MPRVAKTTVAQTIFNQVTNAITNNLPHFRVGKTKLFFPTARVILLRPNAKHTPYQAKFIVPKSFNKLDLRDYLYHVYGLRALSVTTQLLHGKMMHQMTGRFRGPQIKKMTIEMEQPFIWPEEPEPSDNMLWNAKLQKELKEYATNGPVAKKGSDKQVPSKAFDGILGPYEPTARAFASKQLKRHWSRSKERFQQDITTQESIISAQNAVTR